MLKTKIYQSNDVTNDYSMNKQIFNKSLISNREENNPPSKKWYDNNRIRDASVVTMKYKINEQGIPFTKKEFVQLNDVNNALHRVRGGGAVAPKLKHNTKGIGIVPSFPVTPLIRTNNQLSFIPISNKMAMMSKPNNNDIQKFH